MTLTYTAPPAAEPVSLAEARAHLRVTHDAEDDLVSALVAAARARVEEALGLQMLSAGLSETLPPPADGRLRLARGPLLRVDAVSVADGAGGWTPLPAAAFLVEADLRPPVVALYAPARGPVRVDYRAGLAATPDLVPGPLRQAVLALVADAYEHRGDVPATLLAAEPWLAPYRRLRL